MFNQQQLVTKQSFAIPNTRYSLFLFLNVFWGTDVGLDEFRQISDFYLCFVCLCVRFEFEGEVRNTLKSIFQASYKLKHSSDLKRMKPKRLAFYPKKGRLEIYPFWTSRMLGMNLWLYIEIEHISPRTDTTL